MSGMNGSALLDKFKKIQDQSSKAFLKAEEQQTISVKELNRLMEKQLQLSKDLSRVWWGEQTLPSSLQPLLSSSLLQTWTQRSESLARLKQEKEEILKQQEMVRLQQSRTQVLQNASHQERLEAEARILERRHGMKDYQDLKDKLFEREKQLTELRDQQKVALARSTEKKPAFEKDPFFGYLLKQKNKKGKLGVMEKWVGNVCQFNDQYRTYQRLDEIPVELQGVIDSFSTIIDGLKERMHQLDELTLLGSDLREFRDADDHYSQDLLSLQKQTEALNERSSTLNDLIYTLDSGTDADARVFFNGLRDVILNSTEAQRQTLLQAYNTPKVATLIQELNRIGRLLEKASGIAQVASQEVETAQRSLNKSAELIQGLKVRDYDQDTHSFSSQVDWEGLVKSFLQDKITADAFWENIQQSQIDVSKDASSRPIVDQAENLITYPYSA